MAQAVLLYVFYGSYLYGKPSKKVKKPAKKPKTPKMRPIIHGIHMKLTCNRSRFVKNVTSNFKLLIDLVKADPSCMSLLSDKGEGTPTVQFLAAVETGLRRYGCDKYCMGVGALRTASNWAQVDLWRKREAYIACVRLVKYETSSYRKWQNFLWTDFMIRHVLGVTFDTRHAHLSDGADHFQGQAWVPPEWADEVQPSVNASDSDSDVAMRFSPADGKLVPF